MYILGGPRTDDDFHCFWQWLCGDGRLNSDDDPRRRRTEELKQTTSRRGCRCGRRSSHHPGSRAPNLSATAEEKSREEPLQRHRPDRFIEWGASTRAWAFLPRPNRAIQPAGRFFFIDGLQAELSRVVVEWWDVVLLYVRTIAEHGAITTRP
jgi:hypothetical protein